MNYLIRRNALPVIFILITFALSVYALATDVQGEAPSGCIRCHTDAKVLIRLGWEVERVRGKPPASTEIEGED